jgi:hypothetical protein
MSGFTKLVPEIIQSSIWSEPSDTRVVWITMLAMKDADGYVRGDCRALARMANVSEKAARVALECFQQPDPSSHTPDNEGRRIAPAPGGWIVLNHDLYRTGDRTEYMREYMRNRRAKQDAVNIVNINTGLPSASVSASVSGIEKGSVEGKRPKAEKNIIPPSRQDVQARAAQIGFAGWESWFDHFEANGWKVGKAKAPMKDWHAAMNNGKRMAGEFSNELGLTPKRNPTNI